MKHRSNKPESVLWKRVDVKGAKRQMRGRGWSTQELVRRSGRRVSELMAPRRGQARDFGSGRRECRKGKEEAREGMRRYFLLGEPH